MCICTTFNAMRFSIPRTCVREYTHTHTITTCNSQVKLGQNLNQAAAVASKIPVLVHPSHTHTKTQVYLMASLRFSRRVSQIVSRVQCAFAPWVLQTTLTPARTWTLFTHLTTRRGMRAKCKQPYVAQSEVTYTHSRLTLTPTS